MLVLAQTARRVWNFARPGLAGKAQQVCVYIASNACSDVQQTPWHVKAAVRQTQLDVNRPFLA